MTRTINFTIVSITFCFCIIFCFHVEAGTIYVTPSGTGDGSSWGTAKGSITSAIYASFNGDEIWVASGTYREAITLKTGVSLYGGFIGNETTLEQRNWTQNVTTIDGTGKNNSVVIGANTANLIGFTITGGNTDRGGGILCYNYISMTIANCSIISNTATNSGGGLYCTDNCSLSIFNCIITLNASPGESFNDPGWCGGVYCDSSSLNMKDCIISCNSALGRWYGYMGMSMGGRIGGMFCKASFVNMTNCVIARNTNSSHTGGIYCFNNPSLIMTNCTISENTSYDGGLGLVIVNSLLTLTNCTVTGNKLGGLGGDSFSLTLTNCISWNPGDELGNSGNSNIKVSYSCIEGGYPGAGNISHNPLFMNAPNHDFHLQPNSPCIDSGSPAMDMNDGCLPPGIGTVRNDMGAYDVLETVDGGKRKLSKRLPPHKRHLLQQLHI